MIGEEIVFAAVRKAPDGEEWVDLETVRFDAKNASDVTADRDRTNSRVWREKNPVQRVARFVLKEQKP